MTLKTLLQWALVNDIPLDYDLATGESHDSVTLESIRYDTHLKRVILGSNKNTEPKIIEVIASCRCTRARAVKYLENCNWNVPLAIVTFNRENHP